MSAFPMVTQFPCDWCGADIGAGCTTSARRAVTPHRLRFKARSHFIRHSRWVVRLIADDPTFGLSEGDELLVQVYPYDPKVTVIRRIPDGFEPDCNQYTTDVEFVRFKETLTS